VAVVERRHFTTKVASLIAGESATVEADLTYTLNKVPNHYRALQSAIEYSISGPDGGSRQPPLEMPPECWLQRALVFRPQDPNLRVLFGNYYTRVKRYELAVEQYQGAVKLAPKSPEVHYNLGLALFNLQRFDEARKHARTAYSLGYPLPALREQLKAAGFPL
jgi:tetratricopeptide (TPR) repeat protein